MTDRDFAWARIDIPGSKDLWVVSLHIKASSGSSDKEKRANEATLLKSYISANVPSGDYLAVGGDFNTYANDTVNEPCLGVFDDFVTLPANHPRDQGDDGDTNSGRSSPYDRVLVDNDLSACATATIIGAHSFTYGLVLDTRVTSPYSIVADVSPALVTDSAALNMQHMTVVRDFTIPTT
jgi:endonuclease/exonuclease/phosphatase family metal-dependent hydrolase